MSNGNLAPEFKILHFTTTFLQICGKNAKSEIQGPPLVIQNVVKTQLAPTNKYIACT
jgi:hypothetical protein